MSTHSFLETRAGALLRVFMLVGIGLGAWPLSHSGAVQTRLGLDSQVVSVLLNGTDYTSTGAAFSIPADHVFVLEPTMKNTGTQTWGDRHNGAAYGATLLSRNPDFNLTFGTFLISPNQGQNTGPGDTFTYRSALRAPSTPGTYTTTWQLADWDIPDEQYGNFNHTDAIFFGARVTVQVTVTDPTPAPPVKPSNPAVLDVNDFTYLGSFALPGIPNEPEGDKSFFHSGIALRTVNGEQRLIAATGSSPQVLYEVAIPGTLGKIVGNDAGTVPFAEFRTRFGELPRYNGDSAGNGSMWYDSATGLFYWTNYGGYYFGSYPMTFPLLYAGRLDNGVLTVVQQWYQPGNTGAPPKAFWGGVTGIPQSFANQYTGGRTLGIGFGGYFSGSAAASYGPAIAAASADLAGGTLDMLPIIYSSMDDRAVRSGNYFSSYGLSYGLDSLAGDRVPTNPWTGWWAYWDIVRTGVFIDLPDKQGYVTFAHQGVGRINYDWAGGIWNGRSQNAWYFYDFDTLGKAATGQISPLSVPPSSYTTISLPTDATSDRYTITGSAFDSATRRLYVYSIQALPPNQYGAWYQPVVDVYKVTQDLAYGTTSVTKTVGDAPFTNPLTQDIGDVVSFTSANPSVATVDSTTGEVTIVAKGMTTITASAPAKTSGPSASYTLIVTFAPSTYTIATSVDSNGTISPSGAVPVSAGHTWSFRVAPNAGYRLASMGGTCGGSLNGNLYTTNPITANCTVTAAFAAASGPTVTLTQITPSGSASPAAGVAVPVGASGGRATFTITPPAGANYASWAGMSGGCGSIALASTWYVGSNLILKVGPVTSNCTFPIAFSSR